MKAVILAAGGGTRLGALTAEIPKCLLPVSDGVTILDAALSALSAHSVSEIVVVGGHAHGALVRHLGEKWTGTRLRVSLVYNDRYSTANNIVSLACARSVFLAGDDALLINSDVVFEPGILGRLVSASGSALMIDDGKALGAEDMKVAVGEGMRVVEISKALDPRRSQGEYIGLARFGRSMCGPLFSAIDRWIAANQVQAYYEDALNEVLGGSTVRALSTENRPWVEVDTLDDLLEARERFRSLTREGVDRIRCGK